MCYILNMCLMHEVIYLRWSFSSSFEVVSSRLKNSFLFAVFLPARPLVRSDSEPIVEALRVCENLLRLERINWLKVVL